MYPDTNMSPIRQLCIEWAAVAIMMHDMSKVYHGEGNIPERPHLRLDAKVDPLSALIALADVLQDFERPVGIFSSSEYGCVKLSYNNACEKTKISIKNNTLYIEYIMQPKDLPLKRSLLPNEQSELFEPRYGYINIKAWNINNVVMNAK